MMSIEEIIKELRNLKPFDQGYVIGMVIKSLDQQKGSVIQDDLEKENVFLKGLIQNLLDDVRNKVVDLKTGIVDYECRGFIGNMVLDERKEIAGNLEKLYKKYQTELDEIK